MAFTLLTLINNFKLKLVEKEVHLLVMVVEILLLILMILVILKVILMMMLTYNEHQCQHVHTEKESTLVEELGYVVLQEHITVLVAIEYMYVVADEDILARAMPDKEMVMIRLMIGNGKAQILGTTQIWKILFLSRTKGSR